MSQKKQTRMQKINIIYTLIIIIKCAKCIFRIRKIVEKLGIIKKQTKIMWYNL